MQEIKNCDKSDTRIDMTIIDYQMPNTNGEQLAKMIRQYHSTRSLPIVMLSSVDLRNSQSDMSRSGIYKALLKPVRTASLKQAIATALKLNSDVNLVPNKTRKSPPQSNPVNIGDNTGREEIPENTTRTDSGVIDILVAEDNRTNQLVIKSMFKDYNTALRFAANGVIAVEHYRRSRPLIVLMDMSMPEMDGIAATAAIREFEKSQNLSRCPIIALTANAMQGDRERCISAGMNDYLSKPVVKLKLHESVQKYLPDGYELTKIEVRKAS